MKTATDKRNTAKPPGLEIGDYVLIKTERKENKLTPTHSAKPYTIEKGTMITVRNGDHQVTRNASCLKKTNKASLNYLAEEGVDLELTEAKTNATSDITAQLTAGSPEPTVNARPQRTAKKPSYLKDYLC